MAAKPRYRVAAHADGRIESIRRLAGGAPKFGATNFAGASGGGGFEGAQRQRRLFGFRPSEAGINSLLMFSGQTLRARARYLVRNNPYAHKARRVFVTNLVGTGIRPIPLAKDPKVKAAIAELWEEWTEEADADGLVDFYGLQALVASALFEAGECFLRFRPRLARDGLSVPLQLQLLESEFCPYELNFVTANGNIVRSGVEFNPIGQRVAYYFWRTHPGEYAMQPALQTGYTRVPAGDVLHLYEPLRPGQIRGVSWLTASIVTTYFLDQYEDAELARKQTAALFAGFITRPNNSADDPPIGQQDQPAVGTADTSQNADGEVIAGLTPGMMQVLAEGEDIKFAEPADVGPNYEAFEYRALLKMTAGMDMPYSNVTGDFSRANFSSERARMLDLRGAIKPIQRTVGIFQLCKPVMARFVSEAVLAGALPIRAAAYNANPREFARAGWIPPAQDWVNPKDDMAAEEQAMRAGVQSREAVVLARTGKTLEKMDEEIARGNASADAHGLVLDSDPRRTNARGSAAPPDLGTVVETPQGKADDALPDDSVIDDDEEEAAA